MIHFCAVMSETQLFILTILYKKCNSRCKWQNKHISVCVCVVRRFDFNYWKTTWTGRALWGVCMCVPCLVPGLAALWRAGVGWGVVVAGRLHARRFALERFPRRWQWLVHCAQNVGRLGLEEHEVTRVWVRRTVRANQQNTEMKSWHQVRGLAELTFPGVKNAFISDGR